MRKQCKQCCMMLLLGMTLLLSACSNGISISGIDISLKEYSEGMGKSIDEIVDNDKLQYGESYELRLKSEGLESYQEEIPWNRICKISVTVTIRQKKQENNTNIVNFDVEYMNDDGLVFYETREGSGVYNASFELTKNGKCPDLSKGCFVIDVDSVDGSVNAEEILSIEVKATGILLDKKGKEKSQEVTINIGSDVEAALRKDFAIEKGQYTFTEKENISYRIGHQFEKNTMDIKLPEYCQKVKIDVYQDAAKKNLYGSIESTATKNEGTIRAVLTPYFKQFIGEERYGDLVKAGGFKLYLTVIAVGEHGYEDRPIHLTYTVE